MQTGPLAAYYKLPLNRVLVVIVLLLRKEFSVVSLMMIAFYSL